MIYKLISINNAVFAFFSIIFASDIKFKNSLSSRIENSISSLSLKLKKLADKIEIATENNNLDEIKQSLEKEERLINDAIIRINIIIKKYSIWLNRLNGNNFNNIQFSAGELMEKPPTSPFKKFSYVKLADSEEIDIRNSILVLVKKLNKAIDDINEIGDREGDINEKLMKELIKNISDEK